MTSQVRGRQAGTHRLSWRTGVLGQDSFPAGHTCQVTWGRLCYFVPSPPPAAWTDPPGRHQVSGHGRSSAHLSLDTTCVWRGAGPCFTGNRPNHTQGRWNTVGQARGGVAGGCKLSGSRSQRPPVTRGTGTLARPRTHRGGGRSPGKLGGDHKAGPLSRRVEPRPDRPHAGLLTSPQRAHRKPRSTAFLPTPSSWLRQ